MLEKERWNKRKETKRGAEKEGEKENFECVRKGIRKYFKKRQNETIIWRHWSLIDVSLLRRMRRERKKTLKTVKRRRRRRKKVEKKLESYLCFIHKVQWLKLVFSYFFLFRKPCYKIVKKKGCMRLVRRGKAPKRFAKLYCC